MLAYQCKKCGKFTVLGYENGYGEHFCSHYCYKKYCEENNYTYRLKDITQIKNKLTE